MKDGRVRKGEVFSGDADVNDARGKPTIFEAGRHGFDRTCGIDDDVGEVTGSHFFEPGEVGAIHAELDSILDSEIVSAKIQPVLNHVHDDDIDVWHELEEFETGKSDGARSDHKNGLARLGISALYGVVADGEGLDEREFVVGKIVARMELSGRDDPVGFA